jgi:hypothetical protein
MIARRNAENLLGLERYQLVRSSPSGQTTNLCKEPGRERGRCRNMESKRQYVKVRSGCV